MSYYPSSLPSKTKTPGGRLLRVLGVLLSLISILCAALGMVFHQNIASLIFSAVIALLGIRVFVLWLGAANAPSWEGTSSHRGGEYGGRPQGPPPLPTPLPPLRDPKWHSNLGPDTSGPYAPASQLYAASAGTAGRLSAREVPTGSAYAQGPSYPAQPAYALHSSYRESPALYEERQSHMPATPDAFVPIEQDPLFAFDRSIGNERCFILPKEGEPMVECQDRYALNARNRCYAVADGVAGSFVPGPWARIVAKGFVERGGKFANQNDFRDWLMNCSQQWHRWIENRWVPTINALRERNGDRPNDWSNDIRQGAQTTLIGCTLASPSSAGQQHTEDASTSVDIFAIGDGEFFLFSPKVNGGWEISETFPFVDANEFNARPDTLVTVPREDLLERTWVRRKTMHLNVFAGNLIVLASDTMAKWLLVQVHKNGDRWLPLLTSGSASEFEQRIRQELFSGQIEDDDLTMLVIPIT